MAKISLAEHMREQWSQREHWPEQIGPYITISRQYGCWGLSLGFLLLDLLNDQVPAGRAWQVYHKDILDRLATETNLGVEMLERQRRTKPQRLAEFFHSLASERIPTGDEVRNRISEIIRELAIDGYAIIIGQGGAAATSDLGRGLAVRLEAPEEWRVQQVAFRDGLSETEAQQRIQAVTEEKEYLRQFYEAKFPRKPAFNLLFDCSVFTLAQIAQQITFAMKIKGLI